MKSKLSMTTFLHFYLPSNFIPFQMKKAFKVSLVIAVMILLISLLRLSPFGYLIKGVRLSYLQGETSAHPTDWYGFNLRTVKKGSTTAGKIVKLSNRFDYKLSKKLMSELEKTNSASYLIYRNDSLICEKYFNGYSDSHRTNSFSMAKSIMALLVQKSIQEGYISSWDEKAIKFIPWLNENANFATNKTESAQFVQELTLRHLITMTAGLEWDESYVSPWGVTAKAYYSDDVEGVMRSVPLVRKPGTHWQYQSGATQLLTFCLMQALQNPPNNLPVYNTVSSYFSDKFWKPLNMEADAYWSLDHENGKELGYCCFNAISRDFGRLGLLALHQGNWNGEQIIDSSFFALAAQPWKHINYGHGFWISPSTKIPFYYYQGLKGQYICVIPSKNTVIVRTGNGVDKGNSTDKVHDCVKVYVEEGIGDW